MVWVFIERTRPDLLGREVRLLHALDFQDSVFQGANFLTALLKFLFQKSVPPYKIVRKYRSKYLFVS